MQSPAWAFPGLPPTSNLLPRCTTSLILDTNSSSPPSSTFQLLLQWSLLQLLPWFIRQLHWGTLPCRRCTSFPHLRRWRWLPSTRAPSIAVLELLPEYPTEYDVLRAEITLFHLYVLTTLCFFVHLSSLYIIFQDTIEAVILPL